MAKAISIEIEGLDEMIEVFKKAPEETTKELNRFIKKSLLKILGESRKLAPVDQGFLRGAAMVTQFRNLIGILENTAPYAVFVHDGTRPHWPPFGVGQGVEPWARKHGIPAFLAARSISRKGTEGTPFFDDAIKKTQTTVQRIFDRSIDNLLKKLSQ